jgi:hypothetical protein
MGDFGGQLAMITSANLFAGLGVSARTLSPATRQADDFLALLQAQLGKSGGNDPGVPDSDPVKSTSYGVRPGSYIKPMYLGVPIELEPPADSGSQPGPDGVPTDVNSKPLELGAPTVTEPPVDVATTPGPDGEPAELGAPASVGVSEDVADIDLGAPTEEILKA